MDFLLNTKGNVFNDMIVTMKYIQNLKTGDGKKNIKLLKLYLKKNEPEIYKELQEIVVNKNWHLSQMSKFIAHPLGV